MGFIQVFNELTQHGGQLEKLKSVAVHKLTLFTINLDFLNVNIIDIFFKWA